MKEKVSVVLPCYNEKENLLKLVPVIHEILKDYDHEILVIDDNSPDNTYAALLELNLEYLVLILRETDRGFAKSIRCGLENATGDILIIMDSDFNHQPKYLPFMIDNLKYYDCVSASRFLYGGSMDHPIRHMLSWIFNIFVRLMTRGKVTDSLYGFVSIKREVLFRMDFDSIFWGFGDYGIRFFYYLQQMNPSVLQFPAVNGKRYAGESNSGFIGVFKQYFRAVMNLTYRIRIKRDA